MAWEQVLDASAKANIQHAATKVTNRDSFISGVLTVAVGEKLSDMLRLWYMEYLAWRGRLLFSFRARIECEPLSEHSTRRDRVTNIRYVLSLGASLLSATNYYKKVLDVMACL